MSIQDCFNRGTDNCTQNESTNEPDSLCVLQYNPDDENPTCVPADFNMYNVPRGTQSTFDDNESKFFQLVLARLLPSAGTGVTSNDLNQRLRDLVDELKPRVTWKIGKVLSDARYSSWGDLVTKVAKEIIEEIDHVECVICMTNLNEAPVAGEENTFVQNDCCSAIYHTHCLQRWASTNVTCPYCRANLPRGAAPVRSLSREGVRERNLARLDSFFAENRQRSEASRIIELAENREDRQQHLRQRQKSGETLLLLTTLTICLILTFVTS